MCHLICVKQNIEKTKDEVKHYLIKYTAQDKFSFDDEKD